MCHDVLSLFLLLSEANPMYTLVMGGIIEPSTFDSIEKNPTSLQVEALFFNTVNLFHIHLIGVQISLNQSGREILNLFWLAFTRAKLSMMSFVSRNEEVDQQSRNGPGPFPIGGTKSFATSYYTVVCWSIRGI